MISAGTADAGMSSRPTVFPLVICVRSSHGLGIPNCNQEQDENAPEKILLVFAMACGLGLGKKADSTIAITDR